MEQSFVFDPKVRKWCVIFLVLFLILTLSSEVLANAAMTGWYTVKVSNVWIENKNGLMVRGKLYQPETATAENPAAGVVYLHGYQNNRETSDPFAIELGRRGFVVIVLDTLGRGNSDNQFSESDPGFDPTYGAESAFLYLQHLPYVDAQRCGLGGHSLGGEMSYLAAMQNPDVKAIVVSGFAYLDDVTPTKPDNMLMIFGKYDEYRQRMTGVRDFETEWMNSPRTVAAFGINNAQFDTTYGDFEDGSARRVHMTRTTHVSEGFDETAIAEAVTWYHQALSPQSTLAIPADQQIWRIKEIASLSALLFGIFLIIPLAILLLGVKPFSALANVTPTSYVATKKTFRKVFIINALLTLLYLGLVMVIFGLHVYVVPIDGIFPMMMVNGVAFWFIVINIIGFLIFKKWMKKELSTEDGATYQELGISEEPNRIRLKWQSIWRILLFSAVLFVIIYGIQAGLESLFLIDYRYKFPYANDFTPYRLLMFLLYLPFFLVGFIQVNIMVQAQLRQNKSKTWLGTALKKTLVGILFMVTPLLINMAVQYIPLYINGLVPFVGPGGSLVGFVINLEHMIVIQILMLPIASVLYEATGSIYTGAVINALIVTWMFTSSSVIAPLPI